MMITWNQIRELIEVLSSNQVSQLLSRVGSQKRILYEIDKSIFSDCLAGLGFLGVVLWLKLIHFKEL